VEKFQNFVTQVYNIIISVPVYLDIFFLISFPVVFFRVKGYVSQYIFRKSSIVFNRCMVESDVLPKLKRRKIKKTRNLTAAAPIAVITHKSAEMAIPITSTTAPHFIYPPFAY
jgi:hypothetical protein